MIWPVKYWNHDSATPPLSRVRFTNQDGLSLVTKRTGQIMMIDCMEVSLSFNPRIGGVLSP